MNLTAIARDILMAGLEGAAPESVIVEQVRREGNRLFISGLQGESMVVVPGQHSHVYVLGIGKASLRMGHALATVLQADFTRGLLVSSAGTEPPVGLSPRFEVLTGDHPLPGPGSLAAGTKIQQWLQQVEPQALLLVLVSGGASALACLPEADITLEDLQLFTQQLLHCGAPIEEVNALRKPLSRLHGGKLLGLTQARKVIGLLLSDVVGDDPQVIGGGLTVPSPQYVLGPTLEARLNRWLPQVDVPKRIRQWLKQCDAHRGLSEHTKDTDIGTESQAQQHSTVVIGGNRSALRAARACAESLGFHVEILTHTLQGEARAEGRRLAQHGIELQTQQAQSIITSGFSNSPIHFPCCLLFAGETTVTVTGDGMGGRNQELILSAAIGLQGTSGIAMGSVGTDGRDGPTPAAGAVADGTTLATASALQINAEAALNQHNSTRFFEAVGGLMLTGPTGTNVGDLGVLLIE